MKRTCMPLIEDINCPCCGAATSDPLEVTIAANEQNRQLLEEHSSDKWQITEEGEGTMVVRFATRAMKTFIYGILITNSKHLWAY